MIVAGRDEIRIGGSSASVSLVGALAFVVAFIGGFGGAFAGALGGALARGLGGGFEAFLGANGSGLVILVVRSRALRLGYWSIRIASILPNWEAQWVVVQLILRFCSNWHLILVCVRAKSGGFG